MLDLFSGFGGASAAMRSRGWEVIRVDNEPLVRPDVVADVRALPFRPFPVDLLWASPPCTFYARASMRCWFKDEPEPDHTLWEVAEALIAEWLPRWWVIENVRGAIKYHGKPSYSFGSCKLWTNLPMVGGVQLDGRLKHNLCSGLDPLRGAKRGYIPRAISEAICSAVEVLS